MSQELPAISKFDSNMKKKCPHCRNSFPYDTEFRFVENSEARFDEGIKVVELQVGDTTKKGYMVCPTSYDYYKRKATEIKLFYREQILCYSNNTGLTSFGGNYGRMPSQEEVDVMRKNIAAAQRGGKPKRTRLV